MHMLHMMLSSGPQHSSACSFLPVLRFFLVWRVPAIHIVCGSATSKATILSDYLPSIESETARETNA